MSQFNIYSRSDSVSSSRRNTAFVERSFKTENSMIPSHRVVAKRESWISLSLTLVILLSYSVDARYNRLDSLRQSLSIPQTATVLPYDESAGSMIVLPLNFESSASNGHSDNRRLRAFDFYTQATETEDDDSDEVISNNAKRSEGVRRCGLVLLKYIQKLCNGCVGRPRGEEGSTKTKRNPFVEHESLTERCCQRTCNDQDLQVFCCD
ncbi:hypothetical protein M3Y98_00279600 [Aphelenchoides besseyi]|nr:hypothetical protein M3Y98_00279600 [Aphelenchoides besseyi]KAI6201025.1 hypothetical protein M3Y96_00797500 [Aphelenchoides besseyi]